MNRRTLNPVAPAARPYRPDRRPPGVFLLRSWSFGGTGRGGQNSRAPSAAKATPSLSHCLRFTVASRWCS